MAVLLSGTNLTLEAPVSKKVIAAADGSASASSR